MFDIVGNPVAGAIVDVWHANSFGFYSFFGPPQSPYNLRRRIETDREGRYRFRSIMPSGYGCPPGSNTEQLLTKLGRHGQRPAHIHFFVTAPGCRQLTTQINIDGDKYLHDDFAFGTRNDLIPPVERVSNAEEIHKAGQKAAGLTRPLLAFSRRQPMNPRVFNLNTVIRENGEILWDKKIAGKTEFGGQEELYIVTSGRARFSCDGEPVEVAAGGLLHVTHEVVREAVALEDGTAIICVGGVPGQPYTPS